MASRGKLLPALEERKLKALAHIRLSGSREVISSTEPHQRRLGALWIHTVWCHACRWIGPLGQRDPGFSISRF
uniref:Uncharacterized protein n=1 Tax=Triticum urartu TaxID=4572 RepID=A0A8R7PV53_TRIUA